MLFGDKSLACKIVVFALGTRNSRESDQENSVDTGHFPEHTGVAQSEDHRREDKVFLDRLVFIYLAMY